MEAIHIQSFVTAAPALVWRALTGRCEVVLDALPLTAWPESREEESPSRLRAAWPGDGGRTTTVEVTLAAVRGGTRVDLRHEGWEDDAAARDALAGHFAGWLQALAALGLLVEAGKDARASSPALAGRERYFASAEMPAGADTVYRALTDPAVLPRWSEGALDGAEVVDAVEDRYVRWRTGSPADAPAGELVMILRPTPRGTHCALAEYGVVGRAASARWPRMLERLAQFLH